MMPSFAVLLVAVIGYVDTLVCHQCNGWHGSYPLQTTAASTCDNRNNQCKTDHFCVQISDPMTPGVQYTTYKADCWTQTQLQVTPGNSVQIETGKCYDYQDNAQPPKRWKYCFCNNADYCNSANQWHHLTIGLLLLIPFLAKTL